MPKRTLHGPTHARLQAELAALQRTHAVLDKRCEDAENSRDQVRAPVAERTAGRRQHVYPYLQCLPLARRRACAPGLPPPSTQAWRWEGEAMQELGEARRDCTVARAKYEAQIRDLERSISQLKARPPECASLHAMHCTIAWTLEDHECRQHRRARGGCAHAHAPQPHRRTLQAKLALWQKSHAALDKRCKAAERSLDQVDSHRCRVHHGLHKVACATLLAGPVVGAGASLSTCYAHLTSPTAGTGRHLAPRGRCGAAAGRDAPRVHRRQGPAQSADPRPGGQHL